MLLAQGHLFAFVCLDPCLGKLAYKITAKQVNVLVLDKLKGLFSSTVMLTRHKPQYPKVFFTEF